MEFLTLRSDSLFDLQDSIVYRFVEKNVDLRVSGKVRNTGMWYLRNDSLWLEMGELEINVDPDSYSLSSSSRSVASADGRLDFRMKEEFLEAISDELFSIFEQRSNAVLLIGRVMQLSDSILRIENSGMMIEMQKVN